MTLRPPTQGRTLGRASESPGMDTSQGHGAALHGSSTCKVRWSTLPRPQRAQLIAAHCPRRAGVERSTSSTSSFNASTGTASAWRRPPALLGRRPDATTGRLGPVAAHAVRLVPSAASVRACQVSDLVGLLLPLRMSMYLEARVSGSTSASTLASPLLNAAAATFMPSPSV